MCTNKKEITLVNGRKLFVKCGYCDSCMQEKANRQRRYIINEMGAIGYITLFVTLTYSNEFIPFVKKSDLEYDDNFYPVYRNKVIRCVRSNRSGILTYSYLKKRSVKHFDLVNIPFDLTKLHGYRINTNSGYIYHTDYIPILYKADIQNFFKRLKINYERSYKEPLSLSYWYCGEYGPTTKRPHYHVAMHIKQEDFAKVQSSILKSWKFSDKNRLLKGIEISKAPASYLSSYVNSHNYVPKEFRFSKDVSPFCSHSHRYGLVNPSFSLDKITQAFYRRSLHYKLTYVTKNTSYDFSPLIPSYVIRSWFPKIQGFSKLSSYELFEIYSNPRSLSKYVKKIGYSYNDLQHDKIVIDDIEKTIGKGISYPTLSRWQYWLLNYTSPVPERIIKKVGNYTLVHDKIVSSVADNELLHSSNTSIWLRSPFLRDIRLLFKARERFYEYFKGRHLQGFPATEKRILYNEFGLIASQIWSVYASNLLIDSYKDYDELERYENIYQFVYNPKISPSLSEYVENLCLDEDKIEIDVNNLLPNIIEDNRLYSQFVKYDKSKKVNNTILSEMDYQF